MKVAQIAPIIERFLSGVNYKYETEKRGPGVLSGCVVSVDPQTGRAHAIRRIYQVTNSFEVAEESKTKGEANVTHN